MTIKLYENNIYLKETFANIIKTHNLKEKLYLELDKTIFFPVGGGQPSDIGTIDNISVLDVIEKDGIILHQVDKVPDNIEVQCILNWERRFDNMQQHCGEHILSGVIYKLYKGENKGFQLSKDLVRVDINLKEITSEMINKIEEESNKAIFENKEVKIIRLKNLEDAKEVIDVRKKLTVEHDIRIAKIDYIDCVGCCGSHPEKTGEVGIIKILKTEKYKGMTRVYFKCGLRALKDFQQKNSIVNNLCIKYSSDEKTLISSIEKENEKFKILNEKYKILKKEKNESYAVELLERNTENIIVNIFDELESSDLLDITNKVTKESDKIILLGTTNENKVVITHNGKSDFNCGKLCKEKLKDYNGRGGGNEKMAQGVFSSRDDLEAFISYTKGLEILDI